VQLQIASNDCNQAIDKKYMTVLLYYHDHHGWMKKGFQPDDNAPTCLQKKTEELSKNMYF